MIAQTEIDKKETASRLIRAGVKMLECEVDDIAVHIIGSAALRLLSDLLEVKGRQFETELFRLAIFEDAKRIVVGLKPVLPDHPGIDEVTARLVSRLRSGLVSTVEDVSLTWDDDDRRILARTHLRPYDFARHADRNPSETIDLSEFRPSYVLSLAISALAFLDPGRPVEPEIQEFIEKSRYLQ